MEIFCYIVSQKQKKILQLTGHLVAVMLYVVKRTFALMFSLTISRNSEWIALRNLRGGCVVLWCGWEKEYFKSSVAEADSVHSMHTYAKILYQHQTLAT